MTDALGVEWKRKASKKRGNSGLLSGQKAEKKVKVDTKKKKVAKSQTCAECSDAAAEGKCFCDTPLCEDCSVKCFQCGFLACEFCNGGCPSCGDQTVCFFCAERGKRCGECEKPEKEAGKRESDTKDSKPPSAIASNAAPNAPPTAFEKAGLGTVEDLAKKSGGACAQLHYAAGHAGLGVVLSNLGKEESATVVVQREKAGELIHKVWLLFGGGDSKESELENPERIGQAEMDSGQVLFADPESMLSSGGKRTALEEAGAGTLDAMLEKSGAVTSQLSGTDGSGLAVILSDFGGDFTLRVDVQKDKSSGAVRKAIITVKMSSFVEVEEVPESGLLLPETVGKVKISSGRILISDPCYLLKH